MSRSFLARLHFDGTGFIGWQRQASGRSVQGEVEAVLERLAQGRVPCHAAGRTDAGVHARGMGVSFALGERWSAEPLRRALNALLPRDCWVEQVHQMRDGFHARKHARRRRYEYRIGTDPGAASPFRRPFEWALGHPLDQAALEGTASVILGEHDFRSFAVKGPERPHYRCRIHRAVWRPRRRGRGYRFVVEADRFLHHMVRMLVGTMVDAALGRRPVSDMAALLARGDNADTSPPAPPQGLYFTAAVYPADWFGEPT